MFVRKEVTTRSPPEMKAAVGRAVNEASRVLDELGLPNVLGRMRLFLNVAQSLSGRFALLDTVASQEFIEVVVTCFVNVLVVPFPRLEDGGAAEGPRRCTGRERERGRGSR